MKQHGAFLVVQWLRLPVSSAGVSGSIPGLGSSACHKVWPKEKKKFKVNQRVFKRRNWKPQNKKKNLKVHLFLYVC